MADEIQDLLRQMHAARGYVEDIHKIMAAEDSEWLKAFNSFVGSTYRNQRTLDIKTKELLQIVVLTTQRATLDHVKSHVKEAVAAGVSKREILEALETVAMVSGIVPFRLGLQAWAEVVGAKQIEPKI